MQVLAKKENCICFFRRDKYLKRLIESKENGFPKVITGIRRCGESYLLNTIYRDYLIKNGVSSNNFRIRLGKL